MGLLFVLLCQVADAQVGWSDEPVFPITPTIMSTGRWYVTGGTRYRQIQRVSFDKTGTPGGFSVPFGPSISGFFGSGGNTPGYPQYPTYNSADDPSMSGIWVYNNGVINPTNPNVNGTATADPNRNAPTFQTFSWTGVAPNQQTFTSTVETNPGDTAWSVLTYPTIGANVFNYNDPTTTPPTPNYVYWFSGSFYASKASQFGVYNPVTNTWTPNATFGGSTSVRYDLNLNTEQNQTPQPPTQPPLLPTVGDDGFGPQAFDNWLWTPCLEIGLQTESMFDIFYSFSAFSFGNSFGKTVPAWIYPIANSFTDYYNFESINTYNIINDPNPKQTSNNFTSIRTPLD